MAAREHLFLILYDRGADETVVEDLGTDAAAAMEVYAARERGLAERDDMEVVLVGSASLESLRRTHSSYFGAARRLGAALSAP